MPAPSSSPARGSNSSCALVQGSFRCAGSALGGAQRAACLAAMSLAVASAVLGNLLVVTSVLHFRQLQTRANAFAASLAIADLLVGLLVMPFKMTRSAFGCWFYGPAFCAAHTCLDIALCTASILHLACIALDRHAAVCDPLRYAQRVTARRVGAMLALSWSCSAVVSVVPVSLGWNAVGVPREVEAASCPDGCDFLLGAPYAIGSSVCSFFAPAAFVVAAYAKILRVARRQARAIACEQRWRRRQQEQREQREQGEQGEQGEQREQGEQGEQRRRDGERQQKEQPQEQEESRPAEGRGMGGEGIAGGGGRVGRGDYGVEETRAGAGGIETIGKRASALGGERPPPPAAAAGKSSRGAERATDARSERNATKTLSIVVGVFLASWLPFFLVNVSDPLLGYSIEPRAWEAVTWLGYANSAANPVIYGVFSPNFRAAFRAIAARRAFRAGSRDAHLGI